MSDASAEAFRESLRRHGKVVIAPVGWSMWPLLRPGRDTVALEPPARPLRRYDVALYERADDKMVLHRVFRVRGGALVFCGDHCMQPEPPASEAQVCAIMTGFFRDDRYHSVSGPVYWLYCRLWCGALWPRRAARKLRHALSRR